MEISIHKTHTLLKAIEAMPKINTFLRDTFFPGTETFPTEEVLVDIRKGKRKMAPFVAPRVSGVTITREGFKTMKYTAPRMAPQRPITVDDISKRSLGEDVFSTKTPAQRQNELLAKDSMELSETIDRREEWMAAKTLLDGKVILKGYADRTDKNYIEQELDYDFENLVTLSGTDLWTDTNADIVQTLRDARKLCIKKSGTAPDTMILGANAYKAFINSPGIQKAMDLANMRTGIIEPSLVNDAITYVGKLPEIGEIYTYDDWYIDDEGVEQPYIEPDKVLYAKKSFGGFAYGAITQLEDKSFKTYEGSKVPRMWADQVEEQIMYRLSSRPIPKPGDINSWVVLEVI